MRVRMQIMEVECDIRAFLLVNTSKYVVSSELHHKDDEHLLLDDLAWITWVNPCPWPCV